MGLFEPIPQRREQVELTGSKIRVIGRLRHSRHLVFRHESVSCTTRVNWTVIHMNDQWFQMPCLISRNEFFAKRSQQLYSKLVAVHVSIISELIDSVESSRRPHYRKHQILGLNTSLHNCWDVISGNTPHSVRRLVQEKPRLVSCYEMLPSISGGHFNVRDYLSSNLLPFGLEIVNRKMWNSS
jgi:hypothetical protein